LVQSLEKEQEEADKKPEKVLITTNTFVVPDSLDFLDAEID